MELTLSSLALNNQLVSTVLTAVWILVCNGESNKGKAWGVGKGFGSFYY
jgi:hypothetical protein